MKLETTRISIVALTKNQLENYLIADNILENELGLTIIPIPRTINDRVKNAITTKLLPAINESPKDNLLYTFWTIIDKAQNCMIGDLCFKGPPNDDGEIEIGYGTYPAFQGKGYMKEAVNQMALWAFQQENVKSIIAKTDPSNIASQRILENNNFLNLGQEGEYITWKLNND
ncbi:GNAT family N-acetyltransferase [Flavobacterium sangjuense]|uniref:N-acetyltransferase domain-containing protein n=1 Tax=Flavobacterium sangjuense TaxID=2518177 RepID=A0A4P7PTW0_9FLAO|nr:GNAT family N-acetyltransferase [Flavobacterium sangjuense]QBZ98339.1 hypothetical protein GS03_01844 [Flavobacterium sangjuense]